MTQSSNHSQRNHPSQSEINSKVIAIINSKSAPQSIITELLEWQMNQTNSSVLSWIRLPLLYVIENQHDWQNLLKCCEKWKMDKFDEGFYERMKQRIDEIPDGKLGLTQKRADFPRMIEAYKKKNGDIKKFTIPDIQRYLNPVSIPSNKKSQPQNKPRVHFENPQPNQKSNSNSIGSLNTSSRGENSQVNLKPILKNSTSSYISEVIRPSKILSTQSSTDGNQKSKGRRFGGSFFQILDAGKQKSKESRRTSFGFGSMIQNPSKSIFNMAQKHTPQQGDAKDDNNPNKIVVSSLPDHRQNNKLELQQDNTAEAAPQRQAYSQQQENRLQIQHRQRQSSLPYLSAGSAMKGNSAAINSSLKKQVTFKTEQKQQQINTNGNDQDDYDDPRQKSITPRKPVLQSKKINFKKAMSTNSKELQKQQNQNREQGQMLLGSSQRQNIYSSSIQKTTDGNLYGNVMGSNQQRKLNSVIQTFQQQNLSQKSDRNGDSGNVVIANSQSQGYKDFSIRKFKRDRTTDVVQQSSLPQHQQAEQLKMEIIKESQSMDNHQSHLQMEKLESECKLQQQHGQQKLANQPEQEVEDSFSMNSSSKDGSVVIGSWYKDRTGARNVSNTREQKDKQGIIIGMESRRRDDQLFSEDEQKMLELFKGSCPGLKRREEGGFIDIHKQIRDRLNLGALYRFQERIQGSYA